MTNLLVPTDVSYVAKAFYAHDILHILTGLDASTVSELCLGFWQLIATEQGFIIFLRNFVGMLMAPESYKTLYQFFAFNPVNTWLPSMRKSLTPSRQAFAMARGMTKKWPLYNYEVYLDVPLALIRQEFNLKVLC
ncbi:MAG: hypothetical protein AAGE59_25705 [Cyanobacteria bacterium P01_F01_bin.86]